MSSHAHKHVRAHYRKNCNLTPFKTKAANRLPCAAVLKTVNIPAPKNTRCVICSRHAMWRRIWKQADHFCQFRFSLTHKVALPSPRDTAWQHVAMGSLQWRCTLISCVDSVPAVKLCCFFALIQWRHTVTNYYKDKHASFLQHLNIQDKPAHSHGMWRLNIVRHSGKHTHTPLSESPAKGRERRIVQGAVTRLRNWTLCENFKSQIGFKKWQISITIKTVNIGILAKRQGPFRYYICCTSTSWRWSHPCVCRYRCRGAWRSPAARRATSSAPSPS